MKTPTPPPPARSPRAAPLLFWLVLGAGLVSLGGGATLFVLSQAGGLAATGGQGPGLTSTVYHAEQPVSVWWREHWHAGRVERVDGDRYWVSYGQSAQEWVDASRLRPR